jgi:hypothetical protein
MSACFRKSVVICALFIGTFPSARISAEDENTSRIVDFIHPREIECFVFGEKDFWKATFIFDQFSIYRNNQFNPPTSVSINDKSPLSFNRKRKAIYYNYYPYFSYHIGSAKSFPIYQFLIDGLTKKGKVFIQYNKNVRLKGNCDYSEFPVRVRLTTAGSDMPK